MPTILRFRNFRIMIFTDDHEPPHVHAIGPDSRASYNLLCAIRDITLRHSENLKPQEERALSTFIVDNVETLCRAWREIHDHTKTTR